MAVLDALRRRWHFTPTEETIADYVLGHPDEVAGMSIGALAQATHTSNAAVVRLCRKTGVDGYREFRTELAREAERERGGSRDIHPDLPFSGEDGTRDVMDSVSTLTRQAREATYATVQAHTIRRAARLVSEARHVVYYANGDTRVSCEMFENLVLKLGILSIDPDRRGDGPAVAHALDSRDVALVVSYSGTIDRSRNQNLGLDVAVRRGVQVVYITADEGAPERLGRVACTILLPKGEGRAERVATYYSQACIRFVLNCIYGELFVRNWERGLAMRDRIARDYGDA